MLNKLKISGKLNLNLAIVIVGLVILGINIYLSVKNIEKEYQRTNYLANQTSDLKSILIGGLLYNSAFGVVQQNPTKQKAKNTMKSGISKVDEFAKKLKQNSSVHIEKFSAEADMFISIAKKMHQKAINNPKFTKNDKKSSLESWRALKFKVMDSLKVLKKELSASKKTYNEILQSTVIAVIINILIIAVIVIILSVLISNSIKNPLVTLNKAVQALMNYSSADQKIDIKSNDEIGELAGHFNDYMEHMRKVMAEDQNVVEEVEKAIQMARSGFFVYTVTAQTSNRSTNDLKNSVNAMIHDLQEKFQEINNALVEYGNANFNYKFDVENTSGTVGSIIFGTKAIGSNVSELLATIMLSGEKLSSNIEVLSSSANSLSKSANEQAASLEETAAAVEEIASNIASSSENVNKMSKLADEVTDSANNGQNLANQTAVSMQEINDQVTAINEAISVIDQIAFQTNILSLNAAVEAATAGEAGKGFAVVAGEVRNLASRSADAANEIKALVENATSKANKGKSIADEMIEGYTGLSEKIVQNKEIISLVVTSSEEQRKGISQINDAINVLDKNTQENARDASKIDDLAVEVKGLSDRLMSMANHATYRDEAREQVCDIELVYKLNKLKLDHIKFKNNNFMKLNERTTFKVATEKDCDLGKWIEEQEASNQAYTKTSNWKKLKDYHALVHGGVQEYLDKNANQDSNEHLLQTANKIEKATGEVFDSLNCVKRDNCAAI